MSIRALVSGLRVGPRRLEPGRRRVWRIGVGVWVLLLSVGRGLAQADEVAYAPPRFDEVERVARVERVRGLAGEVERVFREHAEAMHIPGVAWGVVVDDALVLSGGMGVADVERAVPVTPRTVFRIASMTKSLTAVAVLRLRDEGRLDLERPVSGHLPEVRRLQRLTADSPHITARHLLTHSAGFPEDNPWGDRQLSDTDGELVALVRGPARFSNATGIEYEYSNLGFALLGRLVRRAGGMSCQAYLDAKVLRPLGMASTYWDPERVPGERLARGYRWEEGRWREEAQLGDGSYASMGGLLSSVEDFARYVGFHMAAWPPRDDRETGPLRRSSLREMHQASRQVELDLAAKGGDGEPCPVVRSYGYGLSVVTDCEGRVRVGHAGGLPGFGSDWRMLPAYGIGIVSFGNRTYCRMGLPTWKALELLVERGGLKPRALPASGILRRRAGELAGLVRRGWEGAEASGIFAENFFADQSVALRRRAAAELVDRVGPIESVSEVEPMNQLRGTFRLVGAQGSVAVFFTLTPEPDPLVQELTLREEPRDAVPH